MNKLFVVSMLALTGVVSVGATQVTYEDVVKMQVLRKPSVGGQVVEGSVAGSVANMPSKNQAGALGQSGLVRVAPPMAQIMTGDPVIDAQLKVLVTEMETKIKAISEEYGIKIKTLVGSRPLKANLMMATGTLSGGVMRATNTQMMGSSTQENIYRAEMMKRRIENVESQMNAGTATNSSSFIQRQGNQGVKPMEQRGIGSQFNSLFRGMFGGDR